MKYSPPSDWGGISVNNILKTRLIADAEGVVSLCTACCSTRQQENHQQQFFKFIFFNLVFKEIK